MSKTNAGPLHLDDSTRARDNPYGLSLEQLIDVVEGYRQRKYNEDMQ